MNVTDRMIEIVEANDKYGYEYVMVNFGVNSETVNRYARAIAGERDKKAKILLFDIETTPIEAYVWSKSVWNASIGHSHVKKEWHMISWAAKWLYDSKMHSAVLTPTEAKNGDDRAITERLWALLDEADIVIAHNAQFDVTSSNTRFIKNGLTRPSPYRVYDTLRTARKEFSFTHNSLDALGDFLGIGAKIGTDFNLWLRCMRGNKSALKEMLRYNKQDVLLLEEVYLKLRGWSKGHPNVALYSGSIKTCTVCGSDDIYKKGSYSTQVNSYDTYQCRTCGGYSRARRVKENDSEILTTVSK